MENTGLPGPAWLSGRKKAIAKLGILPLFVSGRKNPDRMKPLLQEANMYVALDYFSLNVFRFL